MRNSYASILWAGAAALMPATAHAQPTPTRPVERFDRGLVAVPAKDGGNHVSWRLTASDAKRTAFRLLRDGRPIAPRVTGATSFHDAGGTAASRYTLERIGGREPAVSATPWANGYLSIPLDRPTARTTPTGERYEYTANDASVGDLDGDGRYEIVVKWDTTVSKDNAFGGYSGETLLDAYTLDGKRLWRIDLGRNIRSGAHYTHFMVFDFDGDGRAEIMMKTGDGTVDGTGRVLGDPNADWRGKGGEVDQADRTGAQTLPDGRKVARLEGRILHGPEYLSVFDGRTGRALATEPYAPPRGADTPEAMTALWGDAYANRSDRFLAGVAFLDGKRPSGIFARGYYARSTIAAWDWRNGRLTRRWLFDSATPGNEKFGGQGNHNLSVADVDDDGRDEILYGSMALDDTGKGLWSAGLGHGDAMHVADLDPTRPGLEKFGVHENVSRNGGIGSAMLDARTGQVLWTTPATKDTGRGLSADIDPRHAGDENWNSSTPNLYTARGQVIPGPKPRVANFAIWWDGDAQRELLDRNRITKWDWRTGTEIPLLEATGATSNNGTKSNPALSADILGDWREEVVLRSEDSSELRVYTTPYPTMIRRVTLMHDPIYRLGVAWQNTAYNQPPHAQVAPK
ncbi:rhamnogalacturonan lyase [Sphingomonas sp. CFBP 13720]|uniref:rhamnogalacturonan lyase n=1 Tax=Sphingomonas sp. CFBP 13720 TaxID=2775302 RepID=UPI001781B3BC|nr:rhamnogalacturonan lyase [Sphingomonas sp. CFBP 13720]MBD8676988.1 rhamnogalacturonan lyase [Sphingomonas sp. CFBP 13720]